MNQRFVGGVKNLQRWGRLWDLCNGISLFCGLKSVRYIFSAVLVFAFRPFISNCTGLFDGSIVLSMHVKYDDENDSFQINRYNYLIIICRQMYISWWVPPLYFEGCPQKSQDVFPLSNSTTQLAMLVVGYNSMYLIYTSFWKTKPQRKLLAYFWTCAHGALSVPSI